MNGEVRATRRNPRREGGKDEAELSRSPGTIEESKDKLTEMRDVSPARSLRRSSSLPNIQGSIGAKRPKDTAFRQQRLPAWQPILTPYNVIPTLFILAFVFIPLGIIFLVFSAQVQEYSFDYSACLTNAPKDKFAFAPSPLGNVRFEWRRLSKFPAYSAESSVDINPDLVDSDSLCELRFSIAEKIKGPVFQYYKLKNFYQNQRLYVKSVDWQQLKGQAKPADQLADCAPLIGPDEKNAAGNELAYYPCGLIANSMFNDTIGALLRMDDDAPIEKYYFPPKDIAWPFEKERYGPSQYTINDVRPPPFWVNNRKLVDKSGKYLSLPNFELDERFQNWMKVSGLPVFRKTYGKCLDTIAPGTYTTLIASNYEVQSYGASKSLVISNTSWIGGKNSFLGWAYIATGAIFLLLGIGFLIRHLYKPRQLGDVSYLAWSGSSDMLNLSSEEVQHAIK